MYYSFFIIYLVVGFTITLTIFFWAVKNGQFKDQERARFLPLQEEEKRPAVSVSRFNRYQGFAIFGLMTCALLGSTLVLVYLILS